MLKSCYKPFFYLKNKVNKINDVFQCPLECVGLGGDDYNLKRAFTRIILSNRKRRKLF